MKSESDAGLEPRSSSALAPPLRSHAHFILQPDGPEPLQRFLQQEMRLGEAWVESPERYPVGKPVGLIWVHPSSRQELFLPATIQGCEGQGPFEIHLKLRTPALPSVESFARFIAKGHLHHPQQPQHPQGERRPIAAQAARLDPEAKALQKTQSTRLRRPKTAIFGDFFAEAEAHRSEIPSASRPASSPSAPIHLKDRLEDRSSDPGVGKSRWHQELAALEAELTQPTARLLWMESSLMTLLEAAPKDPRVLSLLAGLRCRSGLYKEAQSLLKQALDAGAKVPPELQLLIQRGAG